MHDFTNIIQDLNLIPHPEGGFYKETYRSNQLINRINSQTVRSAYTCIYYLLSGLDYSSWHRISSDETWFFHQGCDLTIYLFNQNKSLKIIQLGFESKQLQITIPANTWFAAKPSIETSYSLVSCAVAPGFEFVDFEIGSRATLLDECGNSVININIIESLTRVI